MLDGLDFSAVVFIVDSDETRILRGSISLRELLAADESRSLEDLMDPYLQTLLPFDDATAAAYRIVSGQLPAMPVTDADGKLIGAMTVEAAIARLLPSNSTLSAVEGLFMKINPECYRGPRADRRSRGSRHDQRSQNLSTGLRLNIRGRSIYLRGLRLPPRGIWKWLVILGPGLIATSAGNDAGGIATYSSAGAKFGYQTDLGNGAADGFVRRRSGNVFPARRRNRKRLA